MDTNVVVAALRSARGASFEVLQALRRAEWRCVLSNHLLLEYEEKLLETAKTLGLPAKEIDGMLTVICAQADEWQLRPNWHPVLPNDPDDEPLVQLAFESGAGLITTHNVRHLEAAFAALGIMILPPGQFLLRIRA